MLETMDFSYIGCANCGCFLADSEDSESINNIPKNCPKCGHKITKKDVTVPSRVDSHTEKELKKTTNLLNESIKIVSQDAKVLEESWLTELLNAINESSTLRRVEARALKTNIEKLVEPWRCDVCDKNYVGEQEKFKLTLCPTCHDHISTLALKQVISLVDKGTEKKTMRMQEWLGRKGGSHV